MKILSGIPSSQFQIVRIQIRSDVSSDLIWVQTVCKGYEQTSLIVKSQKNYGDVINIKVSCAGQVIFTEKYEASLWFLIHLPQLTAGMLFVTIACSSFPY